MLKLEISSLSIKPLRINIIIIIIIIIIIVL